MDRIRDLLGKLPKVKQRQSTRREGRSLWDNYAFLLALLALLGTEWVLRKRVGLL